MNGMYTRPVSYLSEGAYLDNAKRQTQAADLWASAVERWPYHRAAVDLARNNVRLDSARQVLEAGSIGAQIVTDSDTLDVQNNLWRCVDAPTYEHDMRRLPWPIQDARYKLFVALRVWQHLWPVQREAIDEAFRIAEYVLVGAPETYYQDRGIRRETILEWEKAHTLLEEHHIHTGTACNLYLWRR